MYSKVFVYSLKDLYKENCLNGDENEDEISVYLWGILKKECKKLSLKRGLEIPAPQIQTPVQDVDRAINKGVNSLNKPDFTCFRFNTPEGESVGLHIECKKLGKPSSFGWKYNENYVTKGIMRFDSKKHQYGMNVVSGMMIGYIVSMLPKDILKEVNESQSNFLNGYSALKFNFLLRPVFSKQQKIVRKYVVPKNFKILHLWVDLRRGKFRGRDT
ncbi:MAG: hypothetical protein ABIG69_15115 [Bacteroidota bacterium]